MLSTEQSQHISNSPLISQSNLPTLSGSRFLGMSQTPAFRAAGDSCEAPQTWALQLPLWWRGHLFTILPHEMRSQVRKR